MNGYDKEFLEKEGREVEIKTRKELLEKAYEEEEDLLKKAAIKKQIEETEQEEAEKKRVAQAQIQEEKKRGARENRARFWENVKDFGAGVKKSARENRARFWENVKDFGAGVKAKASGGSTRGLFVILSMLMFFFIDIRLAFNGLDFAKFISSLPLILQILGWGGLGLIIIAVGLICIFLKVDRREFGSWLAVVIAFYLIFISIGYDTASFFHMGFALAVLIAYLHPSLGDKAKANFAIVVMLFIDFFLFSALAWLGGITNISALSSARKIFYIPWWTIAILLYPFNLKRSLFVKIVSAVFLIFFVVVYLTPSFSYLDLSAETDFEPKEVIKEQWNRFVDNGGNLILSIATKGEKGTQNLIAKATGPYYTGVVDENEEKPLGVYIEDIKTAYPYFYFDDEIILSAQINVNALSEPVYVAMSCHIKEENGTISPDYYPENDWNFDIAESESILIDCTFNPGLFDQGSYAAIFTADFNFVTYSYLQRYFVDETTARTTAIDKLLKGYDKNPVSHSTGGPVKITMTPSGDSPIILVKPTSDTRYRFGFDIQNNWKSQGGKIKDLNDVIILIPDTMNVRKDLDGYDCSHAVIDASVSDCRAGCGNSELCDEICENAFDGHKGYRIDPNALQQEERLKNIEDVRTFSCEIELPVGNRARVLGETVPNVLEFRAIAKYDYISEAKSSSFQIKLRPGFNVFIEPVKATSSDPLVCKGIHTEKNINKAIYEFYEVVGENEQLIIGPKDASCDSRKRTCLGVIPKQKRDMIIRCKMTATTEDGEEEFDSRTIKIKNSPPIVNAYFDPPQPNPGDALFCKGNVTDEDKDTVEVVYTIENRDENTERFRMATDRADCLDYKCSVEIPSSEVISKRSIRCKLVPHDFSKSDNDWGMPGYAYASVKTPLPTQQSEQTETN